MIITIGDLIRELKRHQDNEPVRVCSRVEYGVDNFDEYFGNIDNITSEIKSGSRVVSINATEE